MKQKHGIRNDEESPKADKSQNLRLMKKWMYLAHERPA
jgi:hypothetical protein